MKFLLVFAASLFLSIAQAAGGPPVDTVRLMTVNGNPMCSAVVLDENIALTARHCIGKGVAVDGKPASKVVMPVPGAGPDIAVLFVPGLQCPCATLGDLPAVGTNGVAVGFPAKDGQRKVVDSGPVMSIEAPSVIAPWIAGYDEEFSNKYILIDNPVLEHGMSGGALFVEKEPGVWVVVGINAIGFPRNPGPGQGYEINGYVPVTDLQALTK